MTSEPRCARATFVGALLLALLPPAEAHAAPGINLMWNRCFGEGSGVQNVSFACNTNAGSRAMVGSFALTRPMPNVIGTEIIVQLASESPALPEWWRFRNAGYCRLNSLSANFVLNPLDVVCVDWAQSFAVGGLGAYCTADFGCPQFEAANVALIKAINAVPQADAMDLLGGVEYFDFNLLINNVKTVGTGNCAGCSTPVCSVLNSIRVVDRGDVSARQITTPSAPGSNFVTWQGGGVPVVGGVSGCPAATPVKRSTWGSVKSLYR